MDKITTKQELINLTKNLLSVEKLARDRYQEESFDFQSEKITTTLKQIKKDEDRHIKMLENLIEKLEK